MFAYFLCTCLLIYLFIYLLTSYILVYILQDSYTGRANLILI